MKVLVYLLSITLAFILGVEAACHCLYVQKVFCAKDCCVTKCSVKKCCCGDICGCCSCGKDNKCKK